jgi:hypothetical protein
MGARLIDLPWNSQPQEAVELSESFGALVAVLPSGGAVRNVSRYYAEPFAESTGLNIGVAVGPAGYGAGSQAQNTNAYRLHSTALQTDTVWERPSARVSLLVQFVRTGNAAGNAPIFLNGSPTTSPFSAWNLFDANGAGTLRFETSAGGSARTLTASVGITNNRITTAIAVYDGATMRLWQDGVLVGTLATTGSLVYPTGGSSGPALGNFWDFNASNRAFVGRVFLGALWDRALADAEVAALTANPWQLFAPQQIFVPRAAAAPALPDLSAITPSLITATGWRDTITAA